jgi:hypothetical protein
MRARMAFLRRVLYWEAAAWTLIGAIAVVAPKFVLVTLLEQVPYPEYSAFRIMGIQAIGISLVAVLIAQRIDDHWWWSWAILFVAAASATVFALTGLLGLPEGSPTWPWWLFSVLALLTAIGLLVGLARAGAEQPIT